MLAWLLLSQSPKRIWLCRLRDLCLAQVLSMPFYKWQALGSQEARVNNLRALLMPASAAPMPQERQAVSGRSSSATVSRGAPSHSYHAASHPPQLASRKHILPWALEVPLFVECLMCHEP